MNTTLTLKDILTRLFELHNKDKLSPEEYAFFQKYGTNPGISTGEICRMLALIEKV